MSWDLLWVCLATPTLPSVLCCAPGPSPEGRKHRLVKRGIWGVGQTLLTGGWPDLQETSHTTPQLGPG